MTCMPMVGHLVLLLRSVYVHRHCSWPLSLQCHEEESAHVMHNPAFVYLLHLCQHVVAHTTCQKTRD